LNWKEYEEEIIDYFRSEYPDARITPNGSIVGRFSKIERQIDLLIEEQASDFSFRIVVDAKLRNKRVDVNDVEQFLGLARDVGADVGVLISPEGYSQAAINRAHFDDSRIELDILNFAELKFFQGFGALPFAGDSGVALPAPFGWVIDIRREQGWLACLYQRGSNLDAAIEASEWMYVNFWRKDENAADLEGLLRFQAQYMTNDRPDDEITVIAAVSRKDQRKTAIRVLKTARYPTPEYTGFVEFEKFIFFCVLFSPIELEDKNLRKLRYILRRVLPLNVRHA
jgi:hypothetical protein